ncbi:hypothetical protein SADUNF_Sadunf04G0096300 [Salix dunnii]|uniref:Uncharacterized protein n=1 Tax=Salix dunnii TaxID=1413687 RepID=A0A835N0T5_9ROSI|nr:hypothetical protein SADUNF_Sadunf04G0096300 [Salix dunnii]
MDGPCWEIKDVETKDESDAGKLRMLKRRMRVFLIYVLPHHSQLQSPSDVPLQVVSSLETQLACQVRPDPAHRLKLTWAKLARTRRGKVAKMRRETLHSTMKATMNEVRREFMEKRNFKRELQEGSLSNRYELEDYNP